MTTKQTNQNHTAKETLLSSGDWYFETFRACQTKCSACGTQITDVYNINKYASINEDRVIGTCCDEHTNTTDFYELELTRDEVDSWTFSEFSDFMYYGLGVEVQ